MEEWRESLDCESGTRAVGHWHWKQRVRVDVCVRLEEVYTPGQRTPSGGM